MTNFLSETKQEKKERKERKKGTKKKNYQLGSWGEQQNLSK